MGKISKDTELAISSKNQIFYEGKKIQKWWGKTLFYFNPKDQQLYYHNFSLFGLIFHLCGYKKKFNADGLNDWLVSKNKTIKDVTSSSTAQKVGKIAFRDKKLEFRQLCIDSNIPSKDIIQMFKEGMDVNTILDEVNTSVLQEACNRGRFSVAEYLIEHGAKVNTRTTDQCGATARTALQQSLQNNHDKLTLFLLEHGADVNTKDAYGDPILHQAISQLNRENDGYTIEEKDKSNTKNIIQIILSKGVEINATGKNNATALHKACEMGDLDVVKWLIAAGADLALKYQGKTAAEISHDRNHPELASYLKTLA